MRKKYTTEEEREKGYKERAKRYRNTQYGRANGLFHRYIQSDKKYGRIGGELPTNYVTAQWIVDNIFTKPCAHCCETDWHKLGCNRLDDSKPHTIDNVEPCCRHCNVILAGKESRITQGEQVDMIDKITGEVLASYVSSQEASRQTKCDRKDINKCCNGERKTHSGYVWKKRVT